jgi:hypothetical protein
VASIIPTLTAATSLNIGEVLIVPCFKSLRQAGEVRRMRPFIEAHGFHRLPG